MTVHLSFRESFPLRFAEWAMSFMMMFWGVVVLLNPGLFQSGPAFHAMGAIMPQPLWGWGASVVGMMGLGALAVNGLWRATPFIRAGCAGVRGFIWLQITFGLAAAGVTTGLAIYPGLIVLEGWNIYRAMGDARVAMTDA